MQTQTFEIKPAEEFKSSDPVIQLTEQVANDLSKMSRLQRRKWFRAEQKKTEKLNKGAFLAQKARPAAKPEIITSQTPNSKNLLIMENVPVIFQEQSGAAPVKTEDFDFSLV